MFNLQGSETSDPTMISTHEVQFRLKHQSEFLHVVSQVRRLLRCFCSLFFPGGPIRALPAVQGLLPQQNSQWEGEKLWSWMLLKCFQMTWSFRVSTRWQKWDLWLDSGAGGVPGVHGGAGDAAGRREELHPASDAADPGVWDGARQHYRPTGPAARWGEDLPQGHHCWTAGELTWDPAGVQLAGVFNRWHSFVLVPSSRLQSSFCL